MTYAFRYIEGRPDAGRVLVELNRRQLALLVSTDNREGARAYDVIDHLTAHRWVREGGQHETLLWIDDGRYPPCVTPSPRSPSPPC